MQVFCPWTDEEVKVLNIKQNDKNVSHYKCEICGNELIATEFGLICPDRYCDFMQSWFESTDIEGDE